MIIENLFPEIETKQIIYINYVEHIGTQLTIYL